MRGGVSPVMGRYRTIVADPPWPSMHQRSTYHRGKPERHYATMAVEDIISLPVGNLAAEDAHLWVWGINRTLEDAYLVVRAWGFRPMTMLTWCKPGPGMGYYLRNNTEHCILATRGKPMVPNLKALSSWFEWPRLRHSEKPHEFFDLVEMVSPAPRLEMFARQCRPNWDAWGDEAPGSIAIRHIEDRKEVKDMGMVKHGSGEVLPDDELARKIASKNWTEKDVEELSKENAETDR